VGVVKPQEKVGPEMTLGAPTAVFRYSQFTDNDVKSNNQNAPCRLLEEEEHPSIKLISWLCNLVNGLLAPNEESDGKSLVVVPLWYPHYNQRFARTGVLCLMQHDDDICTS
jgi:hypothetical protein